MDLSSALTQLDATGPGDMWFTFAVVSKELSR